MRFLFQSAELNIIHNYYKKELIAIYKLGEYWNRVAYDAERTKFLIGAVSTEPSIRNYMRDTKDPYELHIETRECSKTIPVSASK